MPKRIHILPEEVANRIAAGEVVERPVSVVKELVENAIDAGADRISVHVRGGGISSIRVVDNGHGMDPEDSRLSFERHATSKITTEQDLSHIRTLGFRGEALSSIASVSKVVLQTKEKGREAGTLVEISGGKILKVSETGCPEGTDMEVSDLFYNIPARKSFLKAVPTEFRHILTLVGQFGLSYPSIHLQLTHNDRSHLDLPPVKALVERVVQIYGEDIARHLVDVSWMGEDLDIIGVISRPTVTYPDRGFQEFFVNGRAIKNAALSHAVGLAYQDLVPRGRFPVAILFFRLSPDGVDVNVHPTKREVRFRDSSLIHLRLVEALRSALEEGGKGAAAGEPVALPGNAFTIQEHQRRPWESSGIQEGEAAYHTTDTWSSPIPGIPHPSPALFPRIRILGLVYELYILAEVEGELQMIDQHAAHERVLYDRLKKQQEKSSVEIQRLLFPERFELSPQETQCLEEAGSLFKEIGFELEPFGGRTFILSAVPVLLAGEAGADLIREILSEWRISERPMALNDLLIELTGRRACRQAIRRGTPMTEEGIRSLMIQLAETEMPYTCPHGRPVVWKIPREDIEKRFGRR